jgi:PEP-CTERM motif
MIMNLLQNSKILNILALSLLTAAIASATPVQGGAPCTQDTYLGYLSLNDGPGTGCTNPVDPNLEYYNFFFSTSSNTEGNSDIPNNITVSPDGGFGFNFTGFQTVTTGDLTYFLGFNIDPAPVLTGDSISLDPPKGNVILNLYICQQDTPFLTQSEGGYFCSTQPNFGDGSDIQIIFGVTQPAATLTNVDGTDQSTTASFAPTGQIGVLLQLTLNADDPASVGAIGSAPTQILATPEPSTWMLLASGVLAIALWRRFRRAVRF